MVERIATVKHCGLCPKYNKCEIRSAMEIPDECPLPTAEELRNILRKLVPVHEIEGSKKTGELCNHDAQDGARTEP